MTSIKKKRINPYKSKKMEKFRKVPVEIEAVLFTRNNYEEVKTFTNGTVHSLTIEKCIDGKATCIIPTLEGQHIATEGDYIIKGKIGEFYPCKPEAFALTYTKVGNTFKDIFIKHGQEMQRREGVDVTSTEELLAEIDDDKDFQALENMAKDYASVVAKDALSRAAQKFSASHHRDIILGTEIVTP